MGERERNRCRERLAALAGAILDSEQAQRAAIGELRRAVGFQRWCWPRTDPDSGLSMGGIAEFDLWPELPRIAVLEEHGDITSKPRLVLGRRASVALSAATDGDLVRSRRWRECMRPYGIGDELMTACRDRHGCWGSVELMRDCGDRPFSEDDVRLLDDVAPTLGTLLRRSLVRNWRAAPGAPSPLLPGTLILGRELIPSGWTPQIVEWLTELPPAGETLPPAVYEIGARVLARREAAHGLPARVRIRTRSGRWSVVEGAPFETPAEGGRLPVGGADSVAGCVAITIRVATADEVFDVLCKAYDLTPRERQLVEMLRSGLATKPLSNAMRISPYTVQDHLKAIFEKTGMRSRRELVSHLAGRLPATGASAN